jgi:alanyl aminopeptidase
LQATQQVMATDSRPSTLPIRRPVAATDSMLEEVGLAYNKGKAILNMFESWVGPDAFRQGVLDYLKAHAWGNATAADLWSALDRASGKNVSRAMAGFLEQPGFALLQVEPDGDRWMVRQTRFHAYGVTVEPRTWEIPIGLKVRQGGKVRIETYLLTEASGVLDLGPGVEWVYPNLDGRGYYRWTLPAATWEAVGRSAVSDLSPRERIEVLGNAGALLRAGALSGDAYLRTLYAFAEDPEPLVVASLLDALDGVEQGLLPPGEESSFSDYIRRTLGPALTRIGLTPREGEEETISLIRPRLLGWLGDEGEDPGVLDFARTRAAAYLEDPAAVDPASAGTVLSLAARDGNRELFEIYRKRVENAQVPSERARFLTALGAFRNPELREEALRYSLNGPLRPNEMFDVSRGISETEDGRDRVFRWLTDNYDAIMKRLPAEFGGFMPFFASGCSSQRLETARVFFSKPEHQAPGTEKQLAKVADQVQECVTLREREGDNVTRYLRESAQAR